MLFKPQIAKTRTVFAWGALHTNGNHTNRYFSFKIWTFLHKVSWTRRPSNTSVSVLPSHKSLFQFQAFYTAKDVLDPQWWWFSSWRERESSNEMFLHKVSWTHCPSNTSVSVLSSHKSLLRFQAFYTAKDVLDPQWWWFSSWRERESSNEMFLHKVSWTRRPVTPLSLSYHLTNHYFSFKLFTQPKMCSIHNDDDSQVDGKREFSNEEVQEIGDRKWEVEGGRE